MHRVGYLVASLILMMNAAWAAAAVTPTLPDITTTSPLPAGVSGIAYSKTLAATGGTGLYTWGPVFGTLPPGLTLPSTGVLSGTPTGSGTFTFSVEVADATTLGKIPGPTLLDAAGHQNASPGGWSDPRTSFSYRLTGMAVGKDNHNLPPGPPSGDPTGTPDPNLASISYFRAPANGTVTIDGSFATPITPDNFSNLDAVLTIGLVNQPWMDHVTTDHGVENDGYNNRMLSNPDQGTEGPAYLLLVGRGNSIFAGMEDHDGAAESSGPDQRLVASISTFSVQFQAGLDRDGNPVATGGRMRFSLDGGPYGPWENNSRDFVGYDSVIQLSAETFNDGFESMTFGDVTIHSSKEFSLTIDNSSLTIDNTSPLPDGTQDAAYSTTFTASGGAAPLTFALAGDSGPLPAGLTLASDGVLSGTPTAAGTSHIKVQVTDFNTISATKEFDITIDSPPTIVTASPLPAGQVEIAYAHALASTGGTAPLLWGQDGSFPPPAGLSVSSAGVVSGTPSADGTFSFKVHLTDSYSSTTEKDFQITIRRAPSITTASPLPQATQTGAYDQFFAVDGGLAPFTFSIVSGSGATPDGMTLESSGELHGPPSENGSFGFTVRVADAAGGVASKPFTLVVNRAPEFTTTSPLPGATLTGTFSTALLASGGTSSLAFTLDSGALPDGIALDASGLLHGTPTTAGPSSFAVKATDVNGVFATRTFALDVNQVPTITTTGLLPNGKIGVPYDLTMNAVFGTTPFIWEVVEPSPTRGAAAPPPPPGLPPGLALSPAGELSGTPIQIGSYTFDVRLTDANGVRALRTFDLSIFDAPVITTTSPLPSATATGAYNRTFAATGGAPPYTFTEIGALPAGLTLATDGTLSGTPTETGHFPFTVTVTDQAPDQSSKAFDLFVAPKAQITSASPLPEGTRGRSYSFTFTQQDGVSPHVWTEAVVLAVATSPEGSSNLPPGLSLSPGGVLSGTTVTAGDFNLSVRLTDGNGVQTIKAFAMHVNVPPVIDNPGGLAAGTVGTPYSFTYTRTGGTAPFTWTAEIPIPARGASIEALGLPPGVTLDASGVLSGIPTVSGSYFFDVEVMDANGAVGVLSSGLQILPPAPVITTASPLPRGVVGVAYDQAITATGFVLPLTFSQSGGTIPPGLAVNGNGHVTGTPTAVGTYNFTVQVLDDEARPDTKAFDLTIDPVSGGTDFPQTSLLDDFNRPNGPVDGPWAGNTANMVTSLNQLKQNGTQNSMVWDGAVFGPEQEAFVTLEHVSTTATEHDLMLKVQGTTFSSGHLEIRYDATLNVVMVSTYTPGIGWKLWATSGPITFVDGDQLGGRAHASGDVEVFKNGVQVFGASVSTWTYRANGGRLGVTLDHASLARLDNFGGGTLPGSPPPPNHQPTAVAGGNVLSGPAPLAVQFSSAGTGDPDPGSLHLSWTFGDGAISSDANPVHTYTSPGTYVALLDVADERGAEDSASVVIEVGPSAPVGFPTTLVLDDFNRDDGPIGGSWTGGTAGLVTAGHMLKQNSGSNSAVWNGTVFGPEQEAFVRLIDVTATSPEHDLMLKVQGTSFTAGHIEVRYDATRNVVMVSTYTPGSGWRLWDTSGPMTFSPGDQLGARAHADGSVEVFHNGVPVFATSVAGWPFAANGGRLGLTLETATLSHLDDFGGGDIIGPPPANAAPHAFIDSPTTSTFYSVGDVLSLTGHATDDHDADPSLTYRWEIDRVHDGHVETVILFASGSSASHTVTSHDDNLQVSLRVRLIVQDSQGLRDTARVQIFPEIDLEPSAVTLVPDPPASPGTTQYSFDIVNHGRMPAPPSHWRLVASGTLVSEGDVAPPALGTVHFTISRSSLPAGVYSLRLVVDTLQAVHETNENNNAQTQRLQVTGTGSFPSTAVLDDFNRDDGPIGGSWVGGVTGLAVLSHELKQNANANSAVWDGAVFGPEQEAFVTLRTITAAAPEHDLMLKVQGTTFSSGHIEVRYDATRSVVMISTYTPSTGWGLWATSPLIEYSAGDQLGARAHANGAVDVFKNGLQVFSASVAGWAYAANGGRIGITLEKATLSRLDEFGGGDIVAPASTVAGSAMPDVGFTPPTAAGLPAKVALSNPFPNPSRFDVSFALELPQRSDVGFSVMDLMGREVWSEPAHGIEAGRWSLHWSGRDRSGRPMPAGLYLARVQIDGRAFLRRVTLLK